MYACMTKQMLAQLSCPSHILDITICAHCAQLISLPLHRPSTNKLQQQRHRRVALCRGQSMGGGRRPIGLGGGAHAALGHRAATVGSGGGGYLAKIAAQTRRLIWVKYPNRGLQKHPIGVDNFQKAVSPILLLCFICAMLENTRKSANFNISQKQQPRFEG